MNRSRFFKCLLFLPAISLFISFPIKEKEEREQKCKVTYYYTSKQGIKKKLTLFVCKDQANFWRSNIDKYKHIDRMIFEFGTV